MPLNYALCVLIAAHENHQRVREIEACGVIMAVLFIVYACIRAHDYEIRIKWLVQEAETDKEDE